MIFSGAGDDLAFGGEQADVYGDAGADRHSATPATI